MKFKDVLNEYEIYVDDKGIAHDDEGNTWSAGRSYAGGTYGLRNAPGVGSRRDRLSDEAKAYKYGMKLGVSREDVDRYIEDAKKRNSKNPWPIVYSRIKKKAK